MSKLYIPWPEQATNEGAKLRLDVRDERTLTTLTVAESVAALRSADTITPTDVPVIVGPAEAPAPSYGPNFGGRVVGSLVPVRQPEVGGSILVPTEVTRTSAAAVVPYGTLPAQSDIAFTKVEGDPFARFAVFMDADAEVLADRGLVEMALSTLLGYDMAKALDGEALKGDGTGDHWTGILHGSVPTSAKAGGTSHWDTVLAAAKAVRQAGWSGPLAVIASAADGLDILNERDATTKLPFYRPEVWAALGGQPLDRGGLVLTEELSAGTVVVGSFRDAGSVWMRQGITVAASTTVNNDWVTGRVKIMAHCRAAFTLTQPSALYVVTSF